MNRWLIAITVIAGLIAGIWSLSNQVVELPAITITAAHNLPELGLPVYAQFVVTQTLKLTRTSLVSKLTLPVYLPDKNSGPLEVDLRQAGRLQQRWRLTGEMLATGQVAIAQLNMYPPRSLQGEIEIQVSAANVGSQNHDLAPRIFVETDGQNYQDGNYRIAQNQKTGDVEMTLWKIERQDLLLHNLWRNQPLVGVVRVGELGLICLLIGIFPSLVYQLFKHNLPAASPPQTKPDYHDHSQHPESNHQP